MDFFVEKPFDVMTETEKAQLLHNIDQAARGYDPRISQVQAGYREYRRRVWIYNSEGRWAEDERNIVRVRIVALAQKDGLVPKSRYRRGRPVGFGTS